MIRDSDGTLLMSGRQAITVGEMGIAEREIFIECLVTCWAPS